MRLDFALGAAALAVIASGCDRGTRLAGPAALTQAALSVTFPRPVGPDSGALLCLRFNPPGESQKADQVRIVLLAASGARDTVRGQADRTGEATVCLRDTSNISSRQAYTGAELSARIPTSLELLTWHPVR